MASRLGNAQSSPGQPPAKPRKLRPRTGSPDSVTTPYLNQCRFPDRVDLQYLDNSVTLLRKMGIPELEISTFIKQFPLAATDLQQIKNCKDFIESCYSLKSATELATILKQDTLSNIPHTLQARLKFLAALNRMLQNTTMPPKQIDELIQYFPLNGNTSEQPQTIEHDATQKIRQFEAIITFIQNTKLPESLLPTISILTDLKNIITILNDTKLPQTDIWSLIQNIPLHDANSSHYCYSVLSSIYPRYQVPIALAVRKITENPLQEPVITVVSILNSHVGSIINRPDLDLEERVRLTEIRHYILSVYQRRPEIQFDIVTRIILGYKALPQKPDETYIHDIIKSYDSKIQDTDLDISR